MWWRDGFPARVAGAPWQLCIQAGSGAIVLDTTTGQIVHLGRVPAVGYAAAARVDNAAIDRLPPAELSLTIDSGGKTYRCTSVAPWDGILGPRIVESGRFLQRADLNGLVFTADDGDRLAADARLEVTGWPDRLALSLAAKPALAPIPTGEASFGRLGGGFGLDGTNHLEVPHTPATDPEAFTLELWVYMPADYDQATDHVPWLVCRNRHEQADGNYGITITDGVPRAHINIGGGRDSMAELIADGRRPLRSEAWNHVAISYDGQVFRLFVDGEPRGERGIGRPRTRSAPAVPERPGPGGLAFGRRQDAHADGYHFAGAIDEIRLYDRALALDEIRRRFREPEAALADARPVFEQGFRSDGTPLATRPPVVWNNAALGIRLAAHGRTRSERRDLPAQPDGWHDVSIAFDPATTAPPDDSPLVVEAFALPDDTPLAVADDPIRGWWQIDLDRAPLIPPPPGRARASVPVDPRNDSLERVRVRLTNPTESEAVARLLFSKTQAGLEQRLGAPITGISAVLRDHDGHPTGIPVQLSKNWHTRPDGAPYAGIWFHGFSQVRLPPRATADLELTLAYGHWGGIAAASHAQLSLAGWGSNQLWDEAAVGSWGETICFEPDQVQGECAIYDVRPLMVRSRAHDQPWFWTHNVGGGDFFRLFDAAGMRVPPARMKTAYERQGPCLTEVTYAGRIGPGIEHVETVSLARTDDVVRAVYRVRMDVREAVEFSRFVIFQIGADTYSYTGERTMAVGDETGLNREWQTQWGDDAYRMEPVECAGRVPWVSLHDAVPRGEDGEPGAWANRGIVIREWRARLGGAEARPWCAERGVVARGQPTSTIDIVPPPGVARLVPGDFVEAVIEHLVVPMTAADYYGPNEPLRAALTEMGNTWRMIHREATGNDRRVQATTGRLVRVQPDIRFEAVEGIAEFTVQGGLGAVPITVTGLRGHRGASVTIDGARLDQSVHGNDFWQTDHDPQSGTWSQTFTLPLTPDGPHSIRIEPPRP
jgi:hypothetical protein